LRERAADEVAEADVMLAHPAHLAHVGIERAGKGGGAQHGLHRRPLRLERAVGIDHARLAGTPDIADIARERGGQLHFGAGQRFGSAGPVSAISVRSLSTR